MPKEKNRSKGRKKVKAAIDTGLDKKKKIVKVPGSKGPAPMPLSKQVSVS